jgi:hypothetical protein
VIPSPPPSGPAASGSPQVLSPPPEALAPEALSPPHRVSLSLMVVPEGMPTSRLGPKKQSLFFKFKKSKGAQHERQTAQRRQPLINDLHVSNLYSDKVLAERQLLAL